MSQQAVGTAAQAAAVRYWTGSRMTRDLVRQPPPGAPPAWLSGDTRGAGLRWTHGGMVAAAVGRIFFTLGGADYVCSGALVGRRRDPDVVLTAAHCVSDGPGRGRATQWATNWVFVPGFTDGRLPYGEYTARRLPRLARLDGARRRRAGRFRVRPGHRRDAGREDRRGRAGHGCRTGCPSSSRAART